MATRLEVTCPVLPSDDRNSMVSSHMDSSRRCTVCSTSSTNASCLSLDDVESGVVSCSSEDFLIS